MQYNHTTDPKHLSFFLFVRKIKNPTD